MSLENVRNTAESGLSMQEKSLYICSQNIARSKEKGYTRLKLDIETKNSSDVSTGRIIGEVNSYLDAEIRAQTSTSSYTAKKSEYLERIINLFGSPNTSFDRVPDDSEYNVTEALGEFFASINLLGSGPENSAQKQDVVLKAAEVSYLLSSVVQKLDSLSARVKDEIKVATLDMNNQLDLIHKINSSMIGTPEGTEPRADLNMARDLAVLDIASYLNISVYDEKADTISMFTSHGATLVDRVKREVEYTESSDGYMSLNIKTKELTEVSQEIFNEKDNDFRLMGYSGIRALLEVKNDYIVDTRNRISAFAKTFSESINSVFHGATPYPGTKVLTSKAPSFSMDGLMELDGLIKIGPVRQDGQVLTDPLQHKIKALTLDVSEFKTAGELIEEINSYFATPNRRAEIVNKVSNMSLYTKPLENNLLSVGIDVDSSSDLEQVVNFDTIEITYIDRTSGDEKSLLKSMDTRRYTMEPNGRNTFEIIPPLDISSLPDTDFLTVKIDFRVDNTIYSVNYDIDPASFGKILRTDATSISGPGSRFQMENPRSYVQALISDGDVLKPSDTGFFQLTSPVNGVNVAINRIGEPTENDFLNATAFNDFFAITNDIVTGKFQKIEVTSAFQDNPSNIPTAKMTDSPIPDLGIGGNSVVIQLSLLTEKKLSFGESKPETATLLQYVSQIIEHAASNSIGADHDNKREQHMKEISENYRSSISGVNIEEEIQNMINIKYMYNASAHVLSSLKELYSFLMEALS